MLYILLTLFLLLALLCLARIRLDISASDSVEAFAKVLCVKIPLYPQKRKKISTKKFQKGYPRAKEKSARNKSAQPKEKKKEVEKIPISDTVSTVLDLVKLLFSRFFKHLRLDVSKIIIVVGAEDAAKCAIQYGIVSQSVA